MQYMGEVCIHAMTMYAMITTQYAMQLSMAGAGLFLNHLLLNKLGCDMYNTNNMQLQTPDCRQVLSVHFPYARVEPKMRCKSFTSYLQS